jgi:hypothetical protein
MGYGTAKAHDPNPTPFPPKKKKLRLLAYFTANRWIVHCCAE